MEDQDAAREIHTLQFLKLLNLQKKDWEFQWNWMKSHVHVLRKIINVLERDAHFLKDKNYEKKFL